MLIKVEKAIMEMTSVKDPEAFKALLVYRKMLLKLYDTITEKGEAVLQNELETEFESLNFEFGSDLKCYLMNLSLMILYDACEDSMINISEHCIINDFHGYMDVIKAYMIQMLFLAVKRKEHKLVIQFMLTTVAML